ncbi:hypothetical protein [Hymenobacter sp. GOD-10R]|uniref:hypothetical protein n=1 Tax=Hymenobacter sp. GOD-10R TaxID=3093922 RepID=UPI002D7A12B5|nr:hypothetical protein [Hymenobacter sp. GOD-10R]WRQ27775.1 hypothetical protein SD425_22130 [Hymenobacter sp. GOD-10R]
MNTTTRFSDKAWILAFVGLLVLVLGVRLSFVGRGAMSFPDEERYYQSVEAVKSFAAGNLRSGCAYLIRTQGRPADALIRLLPAVGQGIVHATGGPGPHAPASLLVPVLFTYGVSILSLLLYYRLARVLCASQFGALLSTLLYACLANSNLYIRHVLPYEFALCSFLGLVLWLARSRQAGQALTRKQIYGLGVGAAFVVTIYPGYFFVIIALLPMLPNPAVHSANHAAHGLRQKGIRLGETLAVYGSGGLSVLLFFEGLGQLAGVSYIWSCLKLSSTVIQGDFRESFTFLFHYLLDVEAGLGVAVLVLTGLGVLSLLYQAVSNRQPACVPEASRSNALYLGVLGAFLMYAAIGYWGHLLVFYGRILHAFLPFLVLFAVAVGWQAVTPKLQRPLAALLVAVALYSFGHFAARYRQVLYPIDFLTRPSVRLPRQNLVFLYQAETTDNDDYMLTRQKLARTTSAVRGEAMLLNFGFLYPIAGPGCNNIRVPAGFRQVFAAPHFLTLPAYGFEGYSPYERSMLRQCQYQCAVFVR